MFQIYQKEGTIYIENTPIFNTSIVVDEAFIEGLIGKITFNGSDLLIAIAEAQHLAYCSRVLSVAVIPLDANVTCHWHKLKKVNPSERRSSFYDMWQNPTVQQGVSSATRLLRDTTRLVNDMTFDDAITTICDIFSSHTFYYSNKLDLFDSQDAFIFNHMMQQSLDATLLPYSVLILQGFVHQEQIVLDDCHCVFTIISRRSRHRNGLRYQKRGVDDQGFVANFVETKQLLCVEMNSHTHQFQYLQIRGSIPLYWSQENGMKPVPILGQVKEEVTQRAMTLHFQKIERQYGLCTMINLAEIDGKEGVLSMAFLDQFHALSKDVTTDKK